MGSKKRKKPYKWYGVLSIAGKIGEMCQKLFAQLRQNLAFRRVFRGDEQVILSDGEVAIATWRAEKLLDRCYEESGDARILLKPSTGNWLCKLTKKCGA